LGARGDVHRRRPGRGGRSHAGGGEVGVLGRFSGYVSNFAHRWAEAVRSRPTWSRKSAIPASRSPAAVVAPSSAAPLRAAEAIAEFWRTPAIVARAQAVSSMM